MTAEAEPTMLDLSEFQDPKNAMALASQGCPEGYTNVATKHMMDQEWVTTWYMLFGSFVSRMRGLHEGVVREIGHGDPHSVFPLIRAWMETITIGLYVLRNPSYAQFLLYGPGDGGPGRKSFEAMFSMVREDASQLKLVYRELWDYSHFGSRGVWSAHSVTDKAERLVSWTDAPRWHSEKERQIACAQAHELAVLGLSVLDRLGDLLIPDEPVDEVYGEQTGVDGSQQ
jgi:hypothetical protein